MPDNVTSMMYNMQNGPPWHGKGKPVNGLATAAECIRAAGLDWGVAKVPIRVDDIGGLAVPGVMVTVRTDLSPDDPRRILGVVGEEYQPLQNWEAFGFFDRYVSTGAIYETAGAIENGRRIWLLGLPTTPRRGQLIGVANHRTIGLTIFASVTEHGSSSGHTIKRWRYLNKPSFGSGH